MGSQSIDGTGAATFKSRLESGERLIGLWLSLGSPAVAEIAGGSGMDWVLIDREHSPNEVSEVLSQMRALEGRPIHSMVRPPSNDPVEIKRLLDIGVQALMIPFVNDAHEALKAVESCRYPPRGSRGFSGCTRANDYGRNAHYVESAEAGICMVVQVETRAALARVEEIASVSGVSGVFVGAADLSMELGFPGQLTHPVVWDAVVTAADKLRRLGKAAGIMLQRPDDIRRALAAGFTFVAVGSDARLLASALASAAEPWKAATAPAGAPRDGSHGQR